MAHAGVRECVWGFAWRGEAGEGETRGAFYFEYVKDGGNDFVVKLRAMKIFADSGPALMEMVKGQLV